MSRERMSLSGHHLRWHLVAFGEEQPVLACDNGLCGFDHQCLLLSPPAFTCARPIHMKYKLSVAAEALPTKAITPTEIELGTESDALCEYVAAHSPLQ
eukprot:4873631-Amphidinium_carterae.1